MKNKIEAMYPLSPSQQGMLFETLSSPNSGIHIEQSVFSWHGYLNFPAFERAWQRVVARHTVLRTGFAYSGQKEPLQFVLRQAKLPVEWHLLKDIDSKEQQDLSQSVPKDAGRERLESYIEADRRRGFKLMQVPLMRLALFQTDDNLYQIVWTQHHILMDGWSVAIVMKELMAFYKAELRDQDLRLKPSPPYKTYITWLREQELEMSEAFWRKGLQGFTKPTPLATKFSNDHDNQRGRYAYADANLPISATTDLRTLGEQHGLTMNTLIQAGWALLLNHHSGATDVLFGATVSGRPPEVVDVESMVGLFINTLPIRINSSSTLSESLLSWLQAIQNQSLEQQPHSYCSAGQIHQWSEVPAARPLYESLLVFENYPALSNKEDAVSLEKERFEIRSANVIGAQTSYALTILIIPGDELRFHFIYDTRRFEVSDIQQLLTQLLTLLTKISTAPEQPLTTFLLASPELATLSTVQKLESQTSEAFIPPRTDTEQQLAQIWLEVLGLDQVGIDDNFFEIGGHSLLAAQLVSKISVAMQLEFSIKQLFLHPTIAKLSELLDSLGDAKKAVPEKSSHEQVDTKPLKIKEPQKAPSFANIQVEQRPLLSLFATGKIAKVDAAALGYLPLSLLARKGLTRHEVIHDWFDNLPVWTSVTETHWGRIALLLLPCFSDELYSNPALGELIIEALEMAGRIGARAVSLTGLIPSATDYGNTIVQAMGGRSDLPLITTGHAATGATVVLTISRILEEAKRDLSQERVGFIGLGSIGVTTLQLMLRCLPHPKQIMLCDLYSKLDYLAEVRDSLVRDFAFEGEVGLITSHGSVPAELYASTLIIGATNVPDILDITRLTAGTIIVDDSAPHCFASDLAVQRFKEQKDILFTEGGVLQLPHPITELMHRPRQIEKFRTPIRTDHPFNITGCVFSSLLTTSFSQIKPTVGLASASSGVKHYELLNQLRIRAADLHCEGYVLPKEGIRHFRDRFGQPTFPLA